MNSVDRDADTRSGDNSETATPTGAREPVLGELLMSADSAELARQHNRRTVERAASRSSVEAYGLQMQIAAYESYDQWAGVPAALRLRAYANREFGQDLTPEAVRRIRGRVCEALDIDTAAADALPLSRVADILSQSVGPNGQPAEDALAEIRWLKVTQIAKLFALPAGRVTKLADAGTFVTNGKSGHDRRIDLLSVARWELNRL